MTRRLLATGLWVRSCLLGSAGVGAACFGTGNAVAQDVPQAQAQAGDQVQEYAGLEDIVVTARKRAENLQDTPVAVTALTSESLEQRGITTTEQLGQVSPNLQFATYGPTTGNSSAAQVFIRGIGQTFASASVDPGVGLYIDDVYMGSAVGGAMDFRDIASVQVLRGPQGTLFGRNSVGGAVLITTEVPGDLLGGTIRAGLGGYNRIEFSGALDLPLSETLKSRFSFGKRRQDGYVLRSDRTDLGDENTYTLSGKVRWEPTSNFDLTLKGDYSSEDENGTPLVFASINPNAAFPAQASVNAGCPGATFPPAHVPPGTVDTRCANNATWQKGPYTSGGTFPIESTLENWGVSAVANWRLGNGLSLKSITSYRELDWTGKRDADNTALPILHTTFLSSGHQFSQELQLNYSGGTLNAVAGAFYFKSETRENFVVDYTPPFSMGERSVNDAYLGNENWALFAQATYDLTDALSLTAGVRHTEETKSMQLDSYQLSYAPGSTLVRNVDQVDRARDFSNTSFAANVKYRWSRGLMTYASYSQAFKSGGWNSAYNAPQPGLVPTSFDPERAASWEAGFKADVTRSLRLNGAAFDTEYTGLQFTYRVGPVPLLFNAGKARIKGAELELTYAPDEQLMINGSLGYLDARITQVATIVGTTTSVVPGSRLPYAPDWTGNLGVGYRLDFGSNMTLTPRLDYSYKSRQFFDAGNSVAIAQLGAAHNVDASVGLSGRGDQWEVKFGVTNLTDEIYPVAGNSSLTTGSGYAEVAYVRPRTWYASVKVDF